MSKINLEKNKKVVFAGGPGTGKSTLLKAFQQDNYHVMNEVSREIIQQARLNGIEHLFISDPLAFSNKLLEKRKKQYTKASQLEVPVFIDRGIPEITAYLDYNETKYPSYFTKANEKYIYDQVFIFPIWKDIFKKDEVRYETYHQSEQIQKYLVKTYESIGYDLIEVPKTNTKNRKQFVLDKLKNG